MKRLVPDPGSAPGPQLLESCVLSTHTPTGNFTRGSLDSPHVKEWKTFFIWKNQSIKKQI